MKSSLKALKVANIIWVERELLVYAIQNSLYSFPVFSVEVLRLYIFFKCYSYLKEEALG
jgi:hypothetical protein